MYKILLIEDDSNISDVVVKYILNAGYEIKVASNGIEGINKFMNEMFHLIILDVMMPGIDGFEVLETIRHTSDVPIIMLTAKGQEPDRVKGFQKGCDDYVVKPFSPRELIQRVKVLLRRIYNQGDEIIHVNGNLRLYEGSKVVLKGDNQIELSSVEFRLLYALLMHKNQILTREQLIRLSFGDEYEGYDRNIDTYVKRLRNKIEDNPKEPKFIKTKYGQGYKFEGDSHES